MSHNKLHLIRFFGKGTMRWYIKACHLYTEREIAVPFLRNRKRFLGLSWCPVLSVWKVAVFLSGLLLS